MGIHACGKAADNIWLQPLRSTCGHGRENRTHPLVMLSEVRGSLATEDESKHPDAVFSANADSGNFNQEASQASCDRGSALT
jgi:hypothetical protein